MMNSHYNFWSNVFVPSSSGASLAVLKCRRRLLFFVHLKNLPSHFLHMVDVLLECFVKFAAIWTHNTFNINEVWMNKQTALSAALGGQGGRGFRALRSSMSSTASRQWLDDSSLLLLALWWSAYAFQSGITKHFFSSLETTSISRITTAKIPRN